MCVTRAPLLLAYFIWKNLNKHPLIPATDSWESLGMRRGKSGSGQKNNAAPKASLIQKQRALHAVAHMATQTPPTEPATVEEDRFQALMQAISGCKTALMAKVDLLQTDFGLMRRDMDKVRDRLGEAE